MTQGKTEGLVDRKSLRGTTRSGRFLLKHLTRTLAERRSRLRPQGWRTLAKTGLCRLRKGGSEDQFWLKRELREACLKFARGESLRHEAAQWGHSPRDGILSASHLLAEGLPSATTKTSNGELFQLTGAYEQNGSCLLCRVLCPRGTRLLLPYTSTKIK